MSSDPQHGDTMATDRPQRATARAAGSDSQHDDSMSTDHPQCDAAKAAAAPECSDAIATRRPKRATAIAASKAFPGAIKAVEKIIRTEKKKTKQRQAEKEAHVATSKRCGSIKELGSESRMGDMLVNQRGSMETLGMARTILFPKSWQIDIVILMVTN